MATKSPATIILKISMIGLLALGMSLPAQAQSQKLGNWAMYFGMAKLSDKWSIHNEAQYRDYWFPVGNSEQLLLRAGLNYHFAPNWMVTGGYANISTYPTGEGYLENTSIEHRIWQQLLGTQTWDYIKLEHRFRSEQRWIEGDYRNRVRYRLMAFVPLGKKRIESNTFFLGIYDELFVNTRSDWFDRNRLYGALGYQINPATNVQLGLLHQEVGGRGGRYYFQMALFFNPDFRKN